MSIGVPFISQKAISIIYKNKILEKKYYADFLCYDSIIIEIKAIKKITEIEEAQLLNYLKASRKPIGLLINFGSAKLEWKRYVFTNKLMQTQ